MADVFISYKQNERSAIEQIATSLRALGLSVWFDGRMSAGESFNDEIDREARAARAVLVCWSPAARESRWVKAEAMIGFEQNKLVASYVAGPDGFSPPTPFNTSHIEDLRGWLAATSDTHSSWKSILRRIGKLCDRPDIEDWGAFEDRPSVDALRAWISSYRTSPLFMAADKLLGTLEAEGAERIRLEQEARERRELEDEQRRSTAEAERREQEEIERREQAGRQAWDQEIDSAREATSSPARTRERSTVIGLFIVAAVLVAVIVGIALSAPPSVPLRHLVQAPTSYEGIAIGWSRDEVLARRGRPQLVLGDAGSGGSEDSQRIYAVDEWPFELREGQTSRDFGMPAGTTINDYNFWIYTGRENDGHEVHVEFDRASALVVSIECHVQRGFGEACASFRDVRVGDTEQQIVSRLGRPSSASSGEHYRMLRYDQLGVVYSLFDARAVSIEVFHPGSRVVHHPAPSAAEKAEVQNDTAPDPSTQPSQAEVPGASLTEAGSGEVDLSQAAASTAIPRTCEGQSLLYQKDSVVTEVERTGSVIVYSGRAVDGAGVYRYVAYRDLGLVIGDTFCGYQGREGRMRIAGEGDVRR